MKFFSSLFLAAVFFSAVAVRADDLSNTDRAAIRAVIGEQLDAFKRDDASRAFSLATAGIRAQFGTPEVFLDMVRKGYAVVYRPQAVHFDPPEIVDGRVIQPVRMTDADGRTWIALYPMQRQPDGSWRIDGCQLARLQGVET